MRISKVLVSAVGHLAPADSGEFSTFTDLQSPPRSKIFLVCIVAQGGTWFSDSSHKVSLGNADLKETDTSEGAWEAASSLVLLVGPLCNPYFPKSKHSAGPRSPSLLHLPVRLEFAL